MMTKKQLRIAAINDLSGFGRCSLSVAMPVISAMGIQCCPMPTAVLSNHTGYAAYFLDDYTEKLPRFTEMWGKLELQFDGIYTGYLSSIRQVDHVMEFISRFRGGETLLVVDPVMGDGGRLYAGMESLMGEAMKSLVARADITTPNLTEASFLAGVAYDEQPRKEQLLHLARAIAALGAKRVVITGIRRGRYLYNFLYEAQTGEVVTVGGKMQGGAYSGTGDVFASVVAGSIVRGETFERAVRRAQSFVSRAVCHSQQLQVPTTDGVCFEPFLSMLK